MNTNQSNQAFDFILTGKQVGPPTSQSDGEYKWKITRLKTRNVPSDGFMFHVSKGHERIIGDIRTITTYDVTNSQ